MAKTQAIAATSEAIRSLLDRALSQSPSFSSFHASLLEIDKMPSGENTDPIVLVYLHRVTVSAFRRNAPPRINEHGDRLRPPIPVDLYYLITSWAPSPLVEQSLLGFAARTLEDTSILPAMLLNDGPFAGVFRADETVELIWTPLSVQDEADVWQVAQTRQLPSAHYVARGVELDSELTYDEYPEVQTRDLDFGTVTA
jgi:hypothetical protein